MNIYPTIPTLDPDTWTTCNQTQNRQQRKRSACGGGTSVSVVMYTYLRIVPIIISFLFSQNAVSCLHSTLCRLVTKRRSDLWVSLLPSMIYTIPTILPSVITNKNTAVSFHISCKEKNVGVDVSISLYSHTCLWLYIFLYILYSTIMTLFKRTCQGKKKRRSPGQQYGRTWNHKDGLTVAARISLIITTSSPAVTISTTE